MSNIIPTAVFSNGNDDHDGWTVTWGPMANGDVGVDAPVMIGHSDRSVQVAGTFGAGGTMQWEGSIDGINFDILNDPFGVPLSFVSAKIRAVTEAVILSRPHVTAGDGTTSLTVSARYRRTKT
jgi:hypothetical protein